MASLKLVIRVPGSTSNLGPGFDVIGMALKLYLSVTATYSATLAAPDEAKITLTYRGRGEGTVPLDRTNLIISAALHVARREKKMFPAVMDLMVDNQIPLGAGCGSSGAAVVAGVLLGIKACGLHVDTRKVLRLCLELEHHPDNVTASLVGGCVLCIDLSNDPFSNLITPYLTIHTHKDLRAVIAVPNFQLPTERARKILPASYSRQDCVHNLQRVAMLVALLSSQTMAESPTALFRRVMSDKLHQPYRATLIPGLDEILELNDSAIDGLLGTCLSGAGPSCLALAIRSYDEIGRRMIEAFRAKAVTAEALVLEVDTNGATVTSQ